MQTPIRLLIGLLLAAPFELISQELLRYPSLSHDGQNISFSYEGDIWTVPAAGGPARRLTVHESYESHPQWSPDGQHIAFQGNRFGNNDIFVAHLDGQAPTRITWHSAEDIQPAWRGNDSLWFCTRRLFAQVEREWEIHLAPAQGGSSQRALDELGFQPASSPNGRYLAFEKGSSPANREPYRGPANRDIWLFDRQEKTFKQLTQTDAQDILPAWGDDNTLYFLSARTGRYNLYRLQLDKREPEGLTHFSDEGIRHFDISLDGKKAVLEKGNRIYLLDLEKGGIPAAVDIQVSADHRFDPLEFKTYTDGVSEFALSPDEKFVALILRGEIFLLPNDKEKKKTVSPASHPWRERSVQWLSDSSLLFLSDRTGNYELYLLEAESHPYRALKWNITRLTDTPEDENSLLLSPDKKKLALGKGRGVLQVWEIDKKGRLSGLVTLVDGWASPADLSWSTDSRWLAYSLEDLDFNEEVYIQAADGSAPAVNISLHPRSDSRPVWSPDGSKLGFLSIRNNGDADIWFVWLKKADWERQKSDWQEEEPRKEEDKDKKKEEVPLVEIDFDGIQRRLVQVSRLAGNEGNPVISKDGKTFYFTANQPDRSGLTGEPELYSARWDGTELKRIVEKTSLSRLAIDRDGKRIYFTKSGGSLGYLTLDGNKMESLTFEADLRIDRASERRQIFDEAWRSLRDGFYDPQFHGRDWNALRQRHEPLCLEASTAQDFRDMFNEMLGQLDASHMGLTGPSPESTQRETTGELGAELVPVLNGMRVGRVLPQTPASRETSVLSIGDIIRSVDGRPVDQYTDFYALLAGKDDQRTLLEVEDSRGKLREVVIRPVRSVSNALYEDWIESRKALTERYSGGRLGYIHIQGMNWPSFERFERELAASGYGKEGLVIDVRYNGGGWTTDVLLAVLSVRQHAYTIPRGAAADLEKEKTAFSKTYPYGERLPLTWWNKPSVAMCNESSYSNAEIFSHAYQTLELGPLVGQPTFGAVISTGSYGLIDGSAVRMPFRGWYNSRTGQNMENGPAVPDYPVQTVPGEKSQNEDAQLKKAIEVLLERL